MPPLWQEKIIDPKERKVFKALSDPVWDFRTGAGISDSTRLSESEVEAILAKYPQFVRESNIPDRKGRKLFTLRSRSTVWISLPFKLGDKELDFSRVEEALSKVRMFITKLAK